LLWKGAGEQNTGAWVTERKNEKDGTGKVGLELTLSRVRVKSSILTVTMASFALESSLRDMVDGKAWSDTPGMSRRAGRERNGGMDGFLVKEEKGCESRG